MLALSAKPVEPKYTKQTQEEIGKRQGIRLNVIKQQMKESLVQSQAIKQRLQGGKGHGSDFTNLVLGFSDKVHKMASDLTMMSINKSRD